jgi:hypothetical protein
MPDLILRPAGGPEPVTKPWALQLRYHESLGETEYTTIARVSDAVAREIIRAGAAFWLFGDPDARKP